MDTVLLGLAFHNLLILSFVRLQLSFALPCWRHRRGEAAELCSGYILFIRFFRDWLKTPHSIVIIIFIFILCCWFAGIICFSLQLTYLQTNATVKSS